jgi:hypothetical protein
MNESPVLVHLQSSNQNTGYIMIKHSDLPFFEVEYKTRKSNKSQYQSIHLSKHTKSILILVGWCGGGDGVSSSMLNGLCYALVL